MFYVKRGQVPPKRHTQFRKPDGTLYAEELFGVEGFTGRASLLYHHTPPTRTNRIEKVREVSLEAWTDAPHRHYLVNTKDVQPSGDAVSGRIPLFFNHDVTFGVVRPAEAMTRYYRNGEADEMLFVHEGHGTLETIFGPIDYGPGDYLVIPIGTTYRVVPAAGDAQRMLWVESPSAIVPPKRYRNEFGQLLEHSPYAERDIRPPAEMDAQHRDTATSSSRSRPAAGSPPTTTSTIPSTSSAGTGTCGRSPSTSPTSSRSPGGSTSPRRSISPSSPATTSSAASCRASSTTTPSPSRPRTTTRTSTVTRSSTTWPATS